MQCFSGKVHNVQSVPLRLLLPKSDCSDPAWFTDSSMNITILPFENRTGPIFRYQLWLWKYFLKNYITLLPFEYRTSPIFRYQLWLKYFLKNSEVCFHTIIFFWRRNRHFSCFHYGDHSCNGLVGENYWTGPLGHLSLFSVSLLEKVLRSGILLLPNLVPVLILYGTIAYIDGSRVVVV